ncbi:hypothetical protein Ccar_04065 [Clostridium carboxidivorans P7]|uniref:Uncharacterized protein n=1 Tax=Clostridium carboxidivorans P7 TaxID=536227 RepID=C6PRU5_9CLOT|nr:hypothetical protein [Clostridium carboxidivorans]AKN30044.1 hypothetical protein Ccar_04065 [Clostridium carboxidivorans P7]EET87997.1 hypothetical protein CcarbDRAFT_1512 [Clostridium carboxidivorans P7]EFG89049.1 hypothetical protein CLCAR_1233 [Clostridium carboxidivorans P7]
MEEAGKILSEEQNEMRSRLDKALQAFKGKQITIDTNEDIMTNQLYEKFDYNFFKNCEEEALLDFQDEDNDSTPTICINIDDICSVKIDEDVDTHYVKEIEIELKNKFVMNLKNYFL